MYQNLYNQYLETQQKLEQVYQESLETKQDRENKKVFRLKKKQGQKLLLRDTIDLTGFELVMNFVKGSKITKACKRLPLALLYLTEIRVSNLLPFNVTHVKFIIVKGNTNIQLIK